MLALNQVGRTGSHVITQVIETELVVGTEGDISHVCLATSIGVRTVLVDAIYRETIEHIERSHPLRVTLSQVIVDSYDVNTIAGQGIQEYRTGTNEGLTLTSSHLGNLALVQNNTTEELNVVVDHFPLEVIATCCPVIVVDSLVTIDGDEVVGWVGCQLTVKVVGCNHSLLVLCETASGILDDAESSRQNLVEGNLILVECFLLQLVDLVEDSFTLIDWSVFDFSLKLSNLCLFFLGSRLYVVLDFLCFSTEFVIAQGLDIFIFCLNLLYDWLNQLHVTS